MIQKRLSLITQTVLGILVALVIGFLFGEGMLFGAKDRPTPSPDNPPSVLATVTARVVTETPPVQTMEPTQHSPFVTLPDLWLAQVVARVDENPEVVSLSRIVEGRLTVSEPGNSTLTVLDSHEHVLYSLSFQAVVGYYDLPVDVEETNYFFVLPALENAQWLLISTPQGEVKYRFLDAK
jgi:hypothetical protein